MRLEIVVFGKIGHFNHDFTIKKEYNSETRTTKYRVYIQEWFVGEHDTLSDALRWLADEYDDKGE